LNSVAIKKEENRSLHLRVQEIEDKIDRAISTVDDMSYLDKVKINDLHNQIKKIYIKYAPREIQLKVEKLKQEIRTLLEEEELDMYRYSKLDYELKKELKDIKKPYIMSSLDKARVDAFYKRIDKIYSDNLNSCFNCIELEKLIEEKERLLNLI